MAKRIFDAINLSFAATAAGLQTTSNYMAIKGGSGTQAIDVLEVLISGLATASTVCNTMLARVSTIETTPTALTGTTASDGPANAATAALTAAPVTFIAAGTQPTSSSAVGDAKLILGLNLFGGILRWNAAPTQQWNMVGNTADLGESVLFNNSSGGSTGSASAHFIYEPY